jgi:hypothetical protein
MLREDNSFIIMTLRLPNIAGHPTSVHGALVVYSTQIKIAASSVVDGHTSRESLVKFQRCRATVRVRMPGCNKRADKSLRVKGVDCCSVLTGTRSAHPFRG